MSNSLSRSLRMLNMDITRSNLGADGVEIRCARHCSQRHQLHHPHPEQELNQQAHCWRQGKTLLPILPRFPPEMHIPPICALPRAASSSFKICAVSLHLACCYIIACHATPVVSCTRHILTLRCMSIPYPKPNRRRSLQPRTVPAWMPMLSMSTERTIRTAISTRTWPNTHILHSSRGVLGCFQSVSSHGLRLLCCLSRGPWLQEVFVFFKGYVSVQNISLEPSLISLGHSRCLLLFSSNHFQFVLFQEQVAQDCFQHSALYITSPLHMLNIRL